MADSDLNDWSQPEYKRADLGALVRGKYVKRIRESTNVIVLDPQVAKVFRNDEAVNNALRNLIETNRSRTRSGNRKSKMSEKKRAA